MPRTESSLTDLSFSLFLLPFSLLTLLPLSGCRVKMLVSGLWLCWMSKEVSSDCFSKDVNHSQSAVLTVCNPETQGHKTCTVMHENPKISLPSASLSDKGTYNSCVRVCTSFDLFPINIKESCRLNSSKSSFFFSKHWVEIQLHDGKICLHQYKIQHYLSRCYVIFSLV